MNKRIVCMVAAYLIIISIPVAQAQKYDSTPVDLESIWNAVIWYNDGQAVDSSLGLPTNDAGIKISTLPSNVIPGQVNITEDGVVAFLLPDMTAGNLNAYYVAGDNIQVPPGEYQYVFLAVTSDSGNWPGSVSDWAADVDPDTGEIYDPRSEGNSFKPIYVDGEGDWIPIGIVPDWFWKPPEWVAPASGDSSEVIQEYLSYAADPNGPLYFWDGVNYGDHDFGQYTYCNGEDSYFMYIMDIPDGLTSATLWTEMWGNVKFSISTDDETFTELYNSATMDQVYTARSGNLDGYQPNRELRDFDLTPFISSGDVNTIYLMFEDAAPLNAVGQENNPWGARCHRLGIYTGPTVKTSGGSRLWQGMETTSWGSPEGGIYLIWKQYRVDATRTLQSILLPNNRPANSPFLILFAITLANDRTAIEDFMLY